MEFLQHFQQIFEMLFSNWEGIVVAITAIVGGVVKLATVLNAMFPKVIKNKYVAGVKKVFELLSMGTQKSKIIK